MGMMPVGWRNPFVVGFLHVLREYLVNVHVMKETDPNIWNVEVENEFSSKQFLRFHENLDTVRASTLEGTNFWPSEGEGGIFWGFRALRPDRRKSGGGVGPNFRGIWGIYI